MQAYESANITAGIQLALLKSTKINRQITFLALLLRTATGAPVYQPEFTKC